MSELNELKNMAEDLAVIRWNIRKIYLARAAEIIAYELIVVIGLLGAILWRVW